MLNSCYNHSLLQPVGTELSTLERCFFSMPSSLIFNLCNITNTLLLLPVCTFILCHAFQHWRKRSPSSSSSAVSTSHSDCIAFHMVLMEAVRCVGGVLCSFAIPGRHSATMFAGFLLLCFTWFGQLFFHLLTCVERHLAVVHPVTYRSLRSERGVRIRNAATGCVWLFCAGGTCLWWDEFTFVIANLCLVLSSVIIVSFCSISVLRVLIRPGPGGRGGGREKVGQSKRRAFYTILAILFVLVLRFVTNLLWAVLALSEEGISCLLLSCGFWFSLPSGLVLPLHFVFREGKLSGCMKKKPTEKNKLDEL